MLYFVIDQPTILTGNFNCVVMKVTANHQEAVEFSAQRLMQGVASFIIDRWSLKSRLDAATLASACNASAGSNKYIWVDKGNSISPRYDVVELPQIGDDVSYGFNGDYYPCGKITEISGFKAFELGDKAPVSCRRIVTMEANGARHIFWRKGQSGTWLRNKTWSLVKGIKNERNPSF